ncbi:hypothetical protein AB0D08_00620 [Kitasatospora sp. NPDC048540]|uniref:hypothetical protein n=1 Tax=Kitasatospora sp. NPDC048540 TaxID=3155634 RepID=UPI0033C18BCC
MTFKTVSFRVCECGAGRGFSDTRLAGRALGRAQAKRNRRADKHGSRRGLERENRFFECQYGLFHLTRQSRRERTVVGL